MQSVAERLASLPPDQRAAIIAKLTNAEAASLLHDWRGFLARPEQIAPDGDWLIWLVLAGRGYGKTEIGAQWVRERVKAGARSIALVAETQKDLEEVMVARLLRIHAPHEMPTVRYKPVRITWPNGAIALGYNGTEPNQLRGPEFDTAWVDELAKYRYSRETWDMLQFGMRAGSDPRQIVTTTPRPIELIKSLASGGEGKAHITRGKTIDNKSNLAASFMETIQKRYAGTRLGRQELDAEILGDLPGALWSQSVLDTYRVSERPPMGRIVVAVDPAVTDTENSDSHGIMVCGIGPDQAGYVLDDGSVKGSPMDWARATIAKAKEYNADCVVVEVNQGGDMVAHTLRSIAPALNIKEVRASRGKHVRAEPIASLYEQGRIRHVGQFPMLENEMCQMTTTGYQGSGSPDRCFIAGTMVETEHGPKRIETILEGDLVWTRAGLRRVTDAGMTSANASVVTMTATDGGAITGTPNHPVYVIGAGYRTMDALVLGDTLQTLKDTETWQSARQSNSTGRFTTDTQTAPANLRGGIFTKGRGNVATGRPCIEMSGKASMGPFQRAGSFITAMRTGTTTHQKTLSLRTTRATLSFTKGFMGRVLSRLGWHVSRKFRMPLLRGMAARMGWLFTRNSAGSHGMAGSGRQGFAFSAGPNMKPWLTAQQTGSVLASASVEQIGRQKGITRSASASSVRHRSWSARAECKTHAVAFAALRRENGTHPVYNLTVDGENEYFANGILVHNCDALVWAFTDLFPDMTTPVADAARHIAPTRSRGWMTR